MAILFDISYPFCVEFIRPGVDILVQDLSFIYRCIMLTIILDGITRPEPQAPFASIQADSPPPSIW